MSDLLSSTAPGVRTTGRKEVRESLGRRGGLQPFPRTGSVLVRWGILFRRPLSVNPSYRKAEWTSQGVQTLRSPRRVDRRRLVGPGDRILVEPLGPLRGPHDRLDIRILVDAEDHAVFDLGHRVQEDAAIALHPRPHDRGWLIELANPLDRRGIVHPFSGTVIT